MNTYNCKACGAQLKIYNGCNSAKCSYCDTVNYFENNVMLHTKISVKPAITVLSIDNTIANIISGTQNFKVNVQELADCMLNGSVNLDSLSRVRICKATGINISEVERIELERRREEGQYNTAMSDIHDFLNEMTLLANACDKGV